MIYMSFFVGLLLICRGGDWFVDAASFIARAFGIPKYIIGATIVSFATTMPEILVSVAAALKGSSVMAMGNAVGSVSANTGIILGVSLFCLPAVIQRKEYLTKNILYIGCLILLFIAFKVVGKVAVNLSKRNTMRTKGVDKQEAKELSQAPGEVYAAISMALHEMQDEVHDVEDTVLTITRVKRSYSPWSSKIYTLRETPPRK